MSQNLTLDVRGLPAPQPMERVLDAIGEFVPGDRLKLLIDCEPRPLYRILELNGYRHRTSPGAEAPYEVDIWTES